MNYRNKMAATKPADELSAEDREAVNLVIALLRQGRLTNNDVRAMFGNPELTPPEKPTDGA